MNEREGYAANLAMHGYENNLQEAIPKELPHMISSSCVYSDVDSARQCPALHLISAIMNMEREQFKREAVAESSSHYVKGLQTTLTIKYCSHSNRLRSNTACARSLAIIPEQLSSEEDYRT